MTRLCLSVAFSAIGVAGVGLILYAVLAGSRRNREVIEDNSVAIAFSDSPAGTGVFDLDIGHEGLTHRGKESFNPGKHKPEHLEARKKISVDPGE